MRYASASTFRNITCLNGQMPNQKRKAPQSLEKRGRGKQKATGRILLADNCKCCRVARTKCDKIAPICTRCNRLGLACVACPTFRGRPIKNRVPKVRRHFQQSPKARQANFQDYNPSKLHLPHAWWSRILQFPFRTTQFKKCSNQIPKNQKQHFRIFSEDSRVFSIVSCLPLMI